MYERTRETLADELGVSPSPELSAVHVALLRGELARREETRKTNLRAELTSFVGKAADVAGVRELIAEHRLVTLIGPGGLGEDQIGHGNREHPGWRLAGRGLAGGARTHQRGG